MKRLKELVSRLYLDSRLGIVCLLVFIFYYFWSSMLTPRIIGVFDMMVYTGLSAFGIGFGVSSIRRKDYLSKIIGLFLIVAFILLLFFWTGGWIRDFLDTTTGRPRA